MALIVCPECRSPCSQYAAHCPHCGFPNPLAEYAAKAPRAMTHERGLPVPPYREPPPPYGPPVTVRPAPWPGGQDGRPDPTAAGACPGSAQVSHEHGRDNSLAGFLSGRASFWVALTIYYLGGLLLLGTVTVLLGEPAFLLFFTGGWVFVGLFFLLRATRNLASPTTRGLARVILALLIMSLLSALIHQP